jgi:hypothetical protein
VRAMLVVALLLGASYDVVGQTPSTMMGDLQSSLSAAEAAAKRPGDESLSCDALQSELVASARDPAVQSFVAKSGAAAQEKIDAMNSAAAGMAAQSAITIMSSVVPGGAWAGHAANVAQAQAGQAQAARNMQQQMQQAQEMMTIMPQLMRGQRVMDLAQQKDCKWLRDAMAAR